MIWQEASYLWLLVLIPILITLVWWKGRSLKKVQDQFFEQQLFESLRTGFWETGNLIKTTLMIAGLVFIIIAIAGPKIGTEVFQSSILI